MFKVWPPQIFKKQPIVPKAYTSSASSLCNGVSHILHLYYTLWYLPILFYSRFTSHSWWTRCHYSPSKGNLMATRTRRLSIFQQPPILNKATQNYYLFPAMAIALIVALFFSYIPWFQNIMQTRGVGAESIFLPSTCAFASPSLPGHRFHWCFRWAGVLVLFAIGILGMDEIRKFFVRRYPRGPVAKMAW